MSSLPSESSIRDSIPRLIRLGGMTCFLFHLSSLIFHLEFPILGRSIGGERAEEEISVKKRRLFDCFKNAEGIRFRKFAAQIPTMIHRAVLAPPFWRQKVAETNV